jgi:hypothetical protein
LTTPSFTQQLVAVHTDLTASDLPHAIGGALALAFCTLEPRTTHDIDVNVFVGTDRVDDVLAALPRGIDVPAARRRRLERDGQARLWWGETAVDVFLSNHAFHDEVERRCRRVEFVGVDLPVLACEDLAVFKAFFARPKDAVDIAEMLRAGAIDGGLLLAQLGDLLGIEHPSIDFARRAIALDLG